MAAPTVTSISPTNVSQDGGQVLTIKGTGLDTVTGVTVGGVAATNLVLTSATLIAVTLPAQTVLGQRDLVVTNPNGSATKTNYIQIIEHNKTPKYSPRVFGYQTGTVYTSATGETAPWVQEAAKMRLVTKDGATVSQPVPVLTPEYDETVLQVEIVDE